ELFGTPVTPGSLYLQQLRDRLGDAALANIGYSSVPPPPGPIATPTPTPTPTPSGLMFEAENTPNTPGPGITTQPSPDPLASNGIWVAISTKAPGDWIEYQLKNVPAGTYDVVLKYKTNPNRGIHNLAVDGVLINGTLDQFRTGAGTFPEKNFGTVRFNTTGDHIVRLTVVGKRPEAGSFGISADRFALLPDRTAPVITIPDDLTKEAGGPGGAAVTFTASATDDKDGAIPVMLSPPSGSTFPLGITEVVATAVDFAGNRATKQFFGNVVDTPPPILTPPADITLEATRPIGAVATFAASASDIVDREVSMAFSSPSGSWFPIGTTTVTVTATDDFENSTS